MSQETLLIRADANAQIGTGHVMRCLALAQAWQDRGGQSIFVSAELPSALEKRLQSEGTTISYTPAKPGSNEDAIQTSTLAQQAQAKWVVVDGYHFDVNYQQAIKQANLRLLFIDDYGHADHYYADLVLNQNIYADESLYARREPHTRLLLGTQFALLRREFWKWRGWQREIAPVARKVLVTMGGGDPDNVTLTVIQALQQVEIEGLEAIVVIGGSNPHKETLKAQIANANCPIQLKRNVTDMPTLMAWADVAISAGGSTCWELAFMGLPNLILTLAENQRLIAQGLGAAKAAVSLGWHYHITAMQIAQSLELLAHTDLASMSKCGKLLVDGRGSSRVVQQVRT